MEWRDEGVILSVRRHGETSAIAEILTAGHGRVLGLVRGGRSRQQRPVLQAGNAVQVVWRARLEEQLGTFVLEPLDLARHTTCTALPACNTGRCCLERPPRTRPMTRP